MYILLNKTKIGKYQLMEFFGSIVFYVKPAKKTFYNEN
jgi:hypothetical protein